MSTPNAHSVEFRRQILRWWLLVVAALIFAMVLVGGATRVTESGLSIVEWQPVTGIVPPMSDAAWNAEFEKYQAIPQYRELNQGMSLDAFKSIYWWEWSHRLLGRVIGAAFLVPFLLFLWRGWIERSLSGKLWLIFCLGGFQGAVGWWMVTSGLAQGVHVAHERLAFHLTLACIIFAATLWVAQGLRDSKSRAVAARTRMSSIVLLVLVMTQIFFGALVAGLRGGLIYNTWPLIDSAIVPDPARLFFLNPDWRNFFDNVLTVQFEHRMLAYGLWAFAVLHAADVVIRRERAALNGALILASAITIQAGLGILTLVYAAPVALSLSHQAMAMVVLTIAVVHAQGWQPARAELPSRAMPSASRT